MWWGKPGQVDDVVKLGMIDPGVEGQAERGQPGQTRSEVRLPQHMRPRGRAAVADRLAGVPAGRMAHTAEPSATGPDQRFQHRLDAVAEGEIGEAHNASGDTRRPIEAAGAHRGDASDELGFAHRSQLFRSVGAVHAVAFLEHRGDDVMTGADVGEKVVEQVTMVRPIPQVVMGIDNGEVGIEDGLGRLLGQPRLIRRGDPSEIGLLL